MSFMALPKGLTRSRRILRQVGPIGRHVGSRFHPCFSREFGHSPSVLPRHTVYVGAFVDETGGVIHRLALTTTRKVRYVQGMSVRTAH